MALPRPVLPEDTPEYFWPNQTDEQEIHYTPQLLVMAKVHFVDTRKNLAADEELTWSIEIPNDAVDIDWSRPQSLEVDPINLSTEPHGRDATYSPIPTLLSKSSGMTTCKKSLNDHLYRTRRYDLWKCPAIGAYSKPGEKERDFRIRITEQAREKRDELVDKMRKKYATKIRTLEDRIARAEEAVEREQNEADRASMDSHKGEQKNKRKTRKDIGPFS